LKIVGFVGMPGSGKSVAADVAREMKIPVVVMGDVIREEAARRGLDPTDKNLGAVGNDLRNKEGPDSIATRCLAKIRETEADVVVVEGIRSKSEVDLFRKSSNGFSLIEVRVPTRSGWRGSDRGAGPTTPTRPTSRRPWRAGTPGSWAGGWARRCGRRICGSRMRGAWRSSWGR